MKEIQLTQGLVTQVDEADFEWLSAFEWVASKNPGCLEGSQFRATRLEKVRDGWQTVYMHREIIGAKDDDLVDHKDGNPLNNQRDNLRLCTPQQNQANRKPGRRNKSGYKGVSWHKKNKKWSANIRVNNRLIHLGTYEDVIDAARAYNEAAVKHFGEFAWLNPLIE